MKRIDTQPARIICDNPDSPFNYFGWPSVSRLPDDTLAMGASGFRLKHVCPFGKAILCYSRDEGKTWTRPSAVIDTVLDDRDCGVVPFGNGRVMLTSFNNTLAMQRKHMSPAGPDDTAQDTAARALTEAWLAYMDSTGLEKEHLGSTYIISEDGGYTFGPLRKSPVTAPHGPCVLNDGSVLYIGRRFSSDDSFDEGEIPFIQCWRLNELDELEHVSDIPNVTNELGLLESCEPHAIQLPDGKILVHIRMQRRGGGVFTVYQSESLDGGRTFTAPRPILPPLGGSPAHLLLHSSGVLISSYGYRERPYGIRVMFSRDQGETWDTDYVLSDDGESGDLGYPATVELKNGSLLTVYYQKVGRYAAIYQRVWKLPEL